MLTLEHIALERSDGGFKVTDLNLSVVPGELLAVLGPNGAGKSTLVALLGGSLLPDKGSVRMDGRALTQWPRAELARARSVLSQHNALAFRFKVQDVVAMGRLPYRGCGAAADKRSITHALKLADITRFAQRDYLTLSGGEKQRVHLARVLTQLDVGNDVPSDTPRYLLLDEPTSALDMSHQHTVLQVARQLAVDIGFGVLAVLHDPNLAALYADKVAIMTNGQVTEHGSPTDVLSEKLFNDVFQLSVDISPHPRHTERPLVVAGRPVA